MSKKNRANKRTVRVERRVEAVTAIDEETFIVGDYALGLYNGGITTAQVVALVAKMNTVARGFSCIIPRMYADMITRRHSRRAMPRPEGTLDYNTKAAYDIYEDMDAIMVSTS
jgi:hypothetical protein